MEEKAKTQRRDIHYNVEERARAQERRECLSPHFDTN